MDSNHIAKAQEDRQILLGYYLLVAAADRHLFCQKINVRTQTDTLNKVWVDDEHLMGSVNTYILFFS
jgi:hypothetical protein